METVKVQYAKTHLSALLHAVERGEHIAIARGDRVVARLVPIDANAPRELDFVAYDVPGSFFEPLPDAELGAWDGLA